MAAAGNREMIGLDYAEHHLKCSPTLLFSVSTRRFAPEKARRLIAAVDSAVAARADDGPDVEAFEASFVYAPPLNLFYDGCTGTHGYIYRHDHAANITSAHLARWLRFGPCRVTGSFELSPLGAHGPAAGAEREPKQVGSVGRRCRVTAAEA
jgi:hypothetical protein